MSDTGYRYQEDIDSKNAGKKNSINTDGHVAPRADAPPNNRRSSAIPGGSNGDALSAHRGAAGGLVTYMDDAQEHVKLANKEAKERYNATHRYAINGGM